MADTQADADEPNESEASLFDTLASAIEARSYENALRLASQAWGHYRAPPILSDLVDTLAGYVDSEPPTDAVYTNPYNAGVDTPPPPPTRDQPPSTAALLRASEKADPVSLGGILVGISRNRAASRPRPPNTPLDAYDRDLDLWRRYEELANKAYPILAKRCPDPRLVPLLIARVFERYEERRALLATLVESLAEARVVAAMLEYATTPRRGQWQRDSVARQIEIAERALSSRPTVKDSDVKRIEGWLEILRTEPRDWIARVLEDPADAGIREVCSDALAGIGHPYGELIVLQLKDAKARLSSLGRRRMASLLDSHEERWLGSDVCRALKQRIFRNGVLDEASLSAVVDLETWSRIRRDRQLRTVRVFHRGASSQKAYASFLKEAGQMLVSLRVIDGVNDDHLRWLATTKLRAPIEELLIDTIEGSTFRLIDSCSCAQGGNMPSLQSLVIMRPRDVSWSTIVEQLATAPELAQRLRSITARVLSASDEPAEWFRALAKSKSRPLIARLVAPKIRIEVEWVLDGGGGGANLVTIETIDGGELLEQSLHALGRIQRLVLTDFETEKPRRLQRVGRLSEILAQIAPREIEMPTRWSNQLAQVDTT